MKQLGINNSGHISTARIKNFCSRMLLTAYEHVWWCWLSAKILHKSQSPQLNCYLTNYQCTGYTILVAVACILAAQRQQYCVKTTIDTTSFFDNRFFNFLSNIYWSIVYRLSKTWQADVKCLQSSETMKSRDLASKMRLFFLKFTSQTHQHTHKHTTYKHIYV